MSKPIETISFMCGIEIPTLKMLAVGLEWKRIKREWWEVQWFGPKALDNIIFWVGEPKLGTVCMAKKNHRYIFYKQPT